MPEPTPMELAKPAHIVIEDDGSYSVEVRISPTEHLTVEVKGDTIEAAVTRDGEIVVLKSAAHPGVAVADLGTVCSVGNCRNDPEVGTMCIAHHELREAVRALVLADALAEAVKAAEIDDRPILPVNVIKIHDATRAYADARGGA